MTEFFLSHLTPIELDELLSADLDGELDATAIELSYDPAKVRIAITESPRALARRADLERAMVALRSDDATHIDELTRRRLTRRAFGGTGLRNSRSLTLVSISAAAAIVVGVVIAISQHGSKSTNYAAKASSTSTVFAPHSLAPAKPQSTAPQNAAIAGLPSIGTIASEQSVRDGLASIAETGRGGLTTAAIPISTPLTACLDSLAPTHTATRRIALAVASFRGDAVTVVAADVGQVRHLWLIREADCAIAFTLLA